MSATSFPRPWRLLVALAATAAVTVATVTVARFSLAPEAAPPARASNALSTGLARCRALGAAAQDDAACREAWRLSRERFLGIKGEGRP